MTIRVVVADDHPIVLGGLEQLLSSEDDIAVVARCTDGNETFDAIRRERPDVVVADLSMPGRNGLELLRAVPSLGLPVRVVLLTARIEQEQVLQAMQLGVAGIVLKESAPLQILDCVRRVAAGHQWIDQIIGSRTLDGMLRRQAAASVLTAREVEVVRMVAGGLRNKEIAETLAITEGTVKAHLRTIFGKLGIDSRVKLSVYARENALV
ncbi:MAG TPA: response regulator transcription factor [Thermoanaerobaculia bacterium]